MTHKNQNKIIQAFKIRNTCLYGTMSQFECSLDAMPTQTEEVFYFRLAVLLGKNISKASLELADKADKAIANILP